MEEGDAFMDEGGESGIVSERGVGGTVGVGGEADGDEGERDLLLTG